MKSIDTYIEYLLKHKALLSEEQMYKLSQIELNADDSGSFEKFAPSELDALFTLVKTLQAKVVTGDGDLLANATTRDLASLTGSITSLLRAFTSHQQKIDEAKEMDELKEAVVAALIPLPKEARDRFSAVLDSKIEDQNY